MWLAGEQQMGKWVGVPRGIGRMGVVLPPRHGSEEHETSQDTSRGMTRSSPTRRRRPHGCGGGAGRTSHGTHRSQDEHPRVRAARVTHELACAPLGPTASRCRHVQRHSDAAPGRIAAPRGAAQRPRPAASRAHTQSGLTHDLSSRNRIPRKDCTCRADDHGHDAADEGDAAAEATMTGEQGWQSGRGWRETCDGGNEKNGVHCGG
jgi:hypothetical protein